MSYEWMDKAACKGLTHKMFPAYDNDKNYVTEAKAICSTCPVIEPCLNYALEFSANEQHGVWAGLTSGQLAREQRRRGIKTFRATSLAILALGKEKQRRNLGGSKRGPKTGGS